MHDHVFRILATGNGVTIAHLQAPKEPSTALEWSFAATQGPPEKSRDYDALPQATDSTGMGTKL